MGNNYSTQEFHVSLVERDGSKQWVLYDEMDHIGPVAEFPTREHCEQFIQTFNNQQLADRDLIAWAKTAFVDQITNLAAKYGLRLDDLRELV
jgi:hypothetical protein